jgi:hypothetical protein
MAGAPSPVDIYIPWAATATPTYVNSPMPINTQLPSNPGRASYADGFPPQTFESILSGGTGPDGRDMNGICKDITTNIVALSGGQYYEYNSTFAGQYGGYASGAIVAMANGLGLWINRVDSNTNNPDTSPAATSNWIPLAVGGSQSVAMTGGTITLTAVQAACNIIVFTGTVSTTVVLPPWAREFTMVNQTTGSAVVTVQSTGSGSAVVPPGGFSKVVVLSNGNILGVLSQTTFNT